MKDQILVMLWNCDNCGYEAIPALGAVCQSGSHCPNCGYHKTSHANDYVVDSIDQISPTVRDPKLLSLIASGKIGRNLVVYDEALLTQLEDQGVDWKCKFCDAVHPDENLPDNMLYCSNCESWQISEDDQAAPERCERGQIATNLTGSRLADGEYLDDAVVPASLVKDKLDLGQDTSDYQRDSSGVYRVVEKPSYQRDSLPVSSIRRSMSGIPWRSILNGSGIAFGIAAVVSGAFWFFSPTDVEVTITDMPWTVTRDIQELRPTQQSGWIGTVPVDAYNRRSETRQSGTRQVPDGYETYYVTERYQSGTTTETYTESERYQSGTRDDCTTSNNGNGTASRSCRSVPVYSTRPVTKTRTVPVYSTRQVPKQRQKYRDEPVYDTWVFYTLDRWVRQQTLANHGVDDESRIPPVAELDNRPYPERLSSPVETCQIIGTYPWDDEIKSGSWNVPCSNFSLIDIGDTHTMRVNRLGVGELTFDKTAE